MLEEWLSIRPRARVSLSGGKDSTLALWFARQIRPDIPVCFFDSGMEFPQTLTFIARLDREWGLNLHRYPASPDALTVMEQTGSWDHHAVTVPNDVMYDALIEQPSRQANAEHGASAIYGLRAAESRARNALLAARRGEVLRHAADGTVREEYLAPLWRWSDREVMSYIASNSVPLNPLYQQMTAVGVPERARRVGPIINGTILDYGMWVHSRRLAPDLCRQIEARLPRLSEFR